MRHLRLLSPLLLVLASPVLGAAPGDALPVASGDPGLPAGAAPQFQLGRSLLLQGDAAAALPYLHRAFRLAPDVERIAAAFLDALAANGHGEEALDVAATLAREHPDEPGYRVRHGRLLAQAGRYRDALREVESARRLGGDDLELVKLEMDLRESLRDVPGARAVAGQARHLFPEAGEEIALMEAAVLRRAERPREAAAVLGDELARRPERHTLRLALLQTLVAAGDTATAREVARAGDALARESTDETAEPPRFRLQLADLLGRQGRYAEAADILVDLRAQGAAGQDAQLWLGRLLLGLERTDEALALLPEVARRWPQSGEAHYLWGKALVQAGQGPEALPHLREGARLEPKRPDIRLTLLQALVVNRRGELAADEPDARREVEAEARAAAALVAPDDAAGQLILGYAYRALEQVEEAAAHFARAAEVNDVRLQASLELAFCQQDLGQAAAARRTLEDLQEDFPDDPDVANSLGYFLVEQGQDLGRAEALIRQALRSEPENGAFLDSLGWLAYRRGDYAGAFDLLVEAVNRLPDDPVVLEHLGLTLQALGQRAEALDMLRRSLAAGGDEARLRPLIERLRDGR